MTDLAPFAAVVQAPGPFLSLELQTTAAVENAAQRAGLRWKNMRRDLADQGVPDEVLAAVDAVLDDAHLDGDAIGVIATSEGVLWTGHRFGDEQPDWARWELLPSLAPFLEWEQSQPPYVVVLADKTGADIEAFVPHGEDVDETVKGGDDPISKVKPGGWSQRRFQQRAENVWEKNASEVAEAVNRVVHETGARVVVLTGEERILPLLREHLDPEVDRLVRVVDGGRNADSGADELAVDVRRMVQTAVAEDTVALLREFREERGQMDQFADGPRAVAEALQRAQVETLLVHDEPDDPRTAFFGPDGSHVALEAASLKDLGVDHPQEARLADVLIRAALLTGADVRIVPHTSSSGPSDDVGAILRWR